MNYYIYLNSDSYSKIKLFLMKIILTGAAGFIGFHLCNSLLKKGHKVLDLGCAPGGWCQVAAQKVGVKPSKELVVGLDLKLSLIHI